MVVKLKKNKLNESHPEITSLCDQRITENDFLSDPEAPDLQKYNLFIPTALLRKAFIGDYLNLE